MFFSLELSQIKFYGIISDLRRPHPSPSGLTTLAFPGEKTEAGIQRGEGWESPDHPSCCYTLPRTEECPWWKRHAFNCR